MTLAEPKRSEYWGYAAGSVLIGGLLLGPLISFFISRLIPVVEYSPTYSDILVASSLLSILHLASIDRVSRAFNFPYFIKMLIFFNLVGLAAYVGGKPVIFLLPNVLLIAVYWDYGDSLLNSVNTGTVFNTLDNGDSLLVNHQKASIVVIGLG